MADPAAITGIVGAITGLLGASMPFLIDRLRTRRERVLDFDRAVQLQAETNVSNWKSLNDALNREVERLQAENRTLRGEVSMLRKVLGRDAE